MARVISVRLALFAEMVKGKPWTPATLQEVGGTEGVGVTFLEETFSSPQANPKHRLHQKAAQAVLKALLPQTGTDIKGQMRSEAELREASGYAGQPRDFDDLVRILDRELRLITPTDPEEGWRRRGREGYSSARTATRIRSSLLSAHPRLPGPLAAGLADPQAAGDPARPGRAAAGGTRRALERQAGEPAPALGAGVGQHPAADSSQGLERAAAADDAAGRPGAWLAGPGPGDPDRPGELGLDRGLWIPAGLGASVDSLRTANIRDVPARIEQLRTYRRWAGRPLAGLLASTRE